MRWAALADAVGLNSSMVRIKEQHPGSRWRSHFSAASADVHVDPFAFVCFKKGRSIIADREADASQRMPNTGHSLPRTGMNRAKKWTFLSHDFTAGFFANARNVPGSSPIVFSRS